MAKLLKSGKNSWKVVDNNSVLADGVKDGKLVNKRRPRKDEMPVLGDIYLNEGGVMFAPETERGIEHSSTHLREIADLMDGLGKPAQGRRVYVADVASAIADAAAAGK